MKDELLFFEKEDFYAFKDVKEEEGFNIVGITDYIKDNSLINNLDVFSTIIDISTIATYNQENTQLLAEEILRLFNDSTIFVADIKYKEHLTFDLRYCFKEFNDFVIPSSENKKVKAQIINRKHKKITDLSDDELDSFFIKFRESLYGHEKFKDDFSDLVKTFRIFNKIKEHKILSLFLLGESGVGKTEVARTLYKCLGGKKKLAKVNFGNYSGEFSLSSLIGSARGYIGSDDGEIFIRVRDTDIGVILIDEFEKSNASLFNYFLDVLESGKIISSMAEEIDLNGFIVVFTSNISKEDFPLRISPELRSRFDYKGQFTLLYNEDKEKYVEFRVNSIACKVNIEYGMQLPSDLHEYFLSKIDVELFKNMRDLNKKIKKTFVEYLSKDDSLFSEYEDVTTQSKISLGRKIINVFNS